MKLVKIMAVAAAALLTVATSSAEARRYHHRGGACDGFQRCRCGTTAARLNGLPYDYNGMNLKKADTWYGFQHTSFRAGAVAVYPHHVATITGGDSCSSATVHDDAGVYQRNVCGATFVTPGTATTVELSARPAPRRSPGHPNQRVASIGDDDWAAAH